MTPGNPVLAQVIRSGFAESAHRGSVVVTGADGEVLHRAGTVDEPMFPRSSNKPMQAVAMLSRAEPGSPERRVADAMRANPNWTSGSKRPDSRVVRSVPGLLLKSGAEGVEGLALGDGRAAAMKVDDGDHARRVRIPATVALLRLLGADDVPGTDRAALDDLARPLLYGGGRVVGEVQVALPF